MKTILTLLVLLAAAAGVYFSTLEPGDKVTVVGPGTDGDDADKGVAANAGGNDAKGSGAQAAAGTNGKKEPAASHRDGQREGNGQWRDLDKRRRLWANLRPAVERLLPDPDNVGPCPPAHKGARKNAAVRRFRDPLGGFAVWEHDDGSYTYLREVAPRRHDPKSGLTWVSEWVDTGVPTEARAIAPDELPKSSGDDKKDAKKDAKKSGD